MRNRYLNRFFKRQDGSMTVLGLFLLITCFVIGGLALDVANAYKMRTQLQTTADSVAHAALYLRDVTNDANAAKNGALSVGRRMMPLSKHGDVLDTSMIHFGYWQPGSGQFQVDPTSDEAVMVTTTRGDARGNPLGTYFLKFAGMDRWNVVRPSVFETYRPNCFRDGMVAQGRVDAQSNNEYVNGFCIHSQSHVEFNSNNFFDNTTSVTMPDERDLVIPTSGLTSNIGLSGALDSFSYQIRILNQLPNIIAGLELEDPEYLPPYITASGVVPLTSRNLTQADFTSGAVHTASCNGNQKIFIQDGAPLSNIVLVTNCKVQFGQNVMMENVIIGTTNTDARSFNAASTLILGRDDDCTAGGGVQLLTYGGVQFAADLHMYGSQILALGDISFEANATGLQGASFVAGGEIDGTSNAIMGTCGGAGMEGNFEADYFRMAA